MRLENSSIVRHSLPSEGIATIEEGASFLQLQHATTNTQDFRTCILLEERL
ncbi:predicted protein [Botrytis cinerea T4]|uniref:Uncharacterized protein n=1 Tax=Botryotinia fuckeliana (strain T4) TaxID=999810 RepID=G2Y2Q5_BOTF4|nr:predicted protein [Botrytis cinerea T4]